MSASGFTLPGYAELVQQIDALRSASDSHAVALVLIRIAGLQSLNERHSYAAGDHAITEFTHGLQAIAREQDRVLRLGSTRFALLVQSPLNAGHAMLAAQRIGRLADERISWGELQLRVDVSMGCALLTAETGSAPGLIRQAEAALRKCHEGEHRVLLWEGDETAAASTAAHPLFDARKAIENGEFRVHYQPQVQLADNRLVGAEALVRWRGPDGLVAPGSFMNEVERARSLAPLLQFVMNTSSREMARWIRWVPDLKVAINSSASDLEDNDLVGVMRGMLAMWGLAPQHIKLEITETSLMQNPAAGIATLAALRELGIRTAIDDFGTGYSSLAWLKELPVDELKIDRSFVQRMTEDTRDRRLVGSVVELAHALNLTVVAEGIETAATATLLRDMGCDVGQGYYYSRPVTGSEFERCWLAPTARESVAVEHE